MIRALPILIIFMVIMIGSKILDILKIAPDYLTIQVIKAEEEKAPEGKSKETESKENKEKTSTNDTTIRPTEVKENDLLSKYSVSEIEMLQELAKHRQELDNREQDIVIRENSLQVIEKNIQDKIIDLQALQEKLKIVLAEYEKKEDDKIKSLVKIYENMKPVDAAKIFEQLEMDILLDVASNMKEAKLALIFAKMESSSAKELTVKIANRRKIEGIE